MEGIMKIRNWPLLVSALVLLTFGFTTSAHGFGFGDDKFEKEVEKEQGAVKLTREVQRGGYDIITTEELKNLIDSNKDVLVVDTMPYKDSY